MTAQITGYSVLSKFTLNLLKDSSWYSVDFDQAEEFVWGANKGCDFVQPTGLTGLGEFCSVKG